MKKRIACLILALSLCLTLCACAGSAPAGLYADETGMITFEFQEGNVTAKAYGEEVASGTYTVSGKHIHLEFTGEFAEYLNGMDALTYDAKADTLTDGAGAVMTKK